MSVSTPARAVLLGARDLEAADLAAGRGRDVGWDLATLLVAAKPYATGRAPTAKTAGTLCVRCKLYCRQRDGRYELTDAGRQRIREGL